MAEKKTKQFVYKQVRFIEGQSKLKPLLHRALTKKKTVGSRRESLAPDGESPIWRLVGQYSLEDDFVFGVLMRYAPGTHPNFVVDDDQAQSLAVDQLVAPDTPEGKRRELLESTLYFAALDNHLVMMQSASLRSDHLEAHLHWLLHSAKELSGTNTLQLTDRPPKATREKFAKQPVREIDVGGSLEPEGAEVALAHPDSTGSAVAVGDTSSDSDGILSALKSLMSKDKAAKLNLDDLLGSNIEYTLRIRYRNKTSDAGQKLMNTLGSALRHAEGVDTVIKLVGGGEIKGSDLRMSGPVQIETFNGAPNAVQVFEQMRLWLLERLNAGDISPT